ncbi:MAG: Two-component system sensor histidine kinase [uncultured Acidimicrobiales bacterium]|uniref:histidine kinase n=1 Tax=uncultured Acidimicrobiales bacterium TaxID=310071 RepID=A0A6J4HZR2_9ACTN|nr:MAG: Two-component system sensor histidine kinase [uncultured Acidimicrobiales bacterium]
MVDTALALALAALTWGTMGLDEDCPCPARPLAVALALAQTLPLAFRRVAPVPVLVLLGLVTGIHGASTVSDPTVFFGALVALYTAVSLSDRRTSVVLGAVTAVAVGLSVLASGDTPFATVALNYVVFGTAWILGDSVRTHRAYAAELEDRAASAERRRQEDANRAAAEERVRMARELHDVVAHHVSLIAVQSEAAQVLLPKDPGRAAEAVEAIATTARQALTELRRLLGALREDGDGPASVSPQPGDLAIGSLVDSVRDAGVPVSLTVRGNLRPLPDAVAVSAYRIVQESLTNVVKHAGPATAAVVVDYGADELVLEVTDDGRGRPGDGTGHGLVGMRERVTLLGGQLRAGPRREGGFGVEARLPLS